MLGSSYLPPLNETKTFVFELKDFDNECVICSKDLEIDDPTQENTLEDRITKLCHTQFHQSCLDSWLANQLNKEQDATCPTCRKVLIQYSTPKLNCLTAFWHKIISSLFNFSWFRSGSQNDHTI